MFNISNLNFSYNDISIFNNVSFGVTPNDKIGVVGDNGSGKSTLLNLIVGTLKPDKGNIAINHSQVGYIPQQLDTSKSIDELFEPDTPRWKINYAFEQVDLDHNTYNKTVDELSGGQRTRLSIATVLAKEIEPQILVLDEPTNNIDVDGRKWLEQYLHRFDGAVLIASHDRTFLNNVVTKILEIDNTNIAIYTGDYDFYKEQKNIEFQSAMQNYEQYQNERRRLTQIKNKKLTHMRKTSNISYNKIKHEHKASFDASKSSSEKQLGKQMSALDSRINKLEKVDKPKIIKQRSFELDGENARSKIIIKADRVSKSYDKAILEEVDLEIRGGDRIHLQGKNGSGKTTLLKILTGLTSPDSGEVVRGSKVKIGYFSQDISGLDDSLLAIENLKRATFDINAIYSSAASFGFKEKDLNKRIAEFSRGQQAKLSFIKLLLQENHLLVLDEPTNHLDIRTREQLEDALVNYNGAIIVASHDQYFVDQIDCDISIVL